VVAWIAVAALALGLGTLEFRRRDRRHRRSRVALVLVAVTAIGALLSPPTIPAAGSDPSTIVLVTPGATRAELESAADSFPGAPAVSWPDSVADLGALRERFPALRRVVVVGWGVRSGWWEGDSGLEVSLVPGPVPPGIELAAWPRTVRLGEAVRIAGRLRGVMDSLVLLEGPGGEVDTIHPTPADVGRFQVEVVPAAAGRARYIASAASVPPETLFIAVEPSIPPAVLVLEGAPSFETTFLRRWLASQGGKMAIRTRLSLDRDRIERVNAPDQALRPLSPELLSGFNLLMVDGPTLRGFSPAERRALAAAIQDEGLGLLVLPDSLASREGEFFPFALTPTGELDGRTVRPRWVGQRDRSTTGVPVEAMEIALAPGQRDLIQDPVGRSLAAMVRAGTGRIGTTLVTAPSRWQLEGDRQSYAEYWSRLYQAMARGQGDAWQLDADGPVVEQFGASLGITTDDPSPRVEVTAPDGSVDTVGVAQDLADPARWWGMFWPRMPGWHRATNRGGAAYEFHVESMRHTPAEAEARLRGTTARAALSQPAGPAALREVRRPLPPLIPFVLLVVALAALWAEGRGLFPDRGGPRSPAPS